MVTAVTEPDALTDVDATQAVPRVGTKTTSPGM